MASKPETRGIVEKGIFLMLDGVLLMKDEEDEQKR